MPAGSGAMLVLVVLHMCCCIPMRVQALGETEKREVKMSEVRCS